MIVTTLLALSLAIIIYSAMKGRKMMSVLLKFMMLSLLVMGPALAQDDIGLVGVWGIPEDGIIIPPDGGPIVIPIPDAVNVLVDADSWTASAIAFLNGNDTLVMNQYNNTTLVVA